MDRKLALQIIDKAVNTIIEAQKWLADDNKRFDGAQAPRRQAAYKAGSFPKVCSCKMAYDEEEWLLLDLAGVQEGTDEGHRFYDDLEMRECVVCGSQMSVPIKEGL